MKKGGEDDTFSLIKKKKARANQEIRKREKKNQLKKRKELADSCADGRTV